MIAKKKLLFYFRPKNTPHNVPKINVFYLQKIIRGWGRIIPGSAKLHFSFALFFLLSA